MPARSQADLFKAPLPDVPLAAELVSVAEEADLIRRIDASGLSPFRFQGWLGKRLTASLGWRYDFEDSSFAPTDPLPDWLLPLRDRAAAFAVLSPDALVQALLTRYDPGAGIGWHRDRSVFGEVIGISLGAPAKLRFRLRKEGGFDRFVVPLEPRSAYHLTGEARHVWEHSIVAIQAPRWSITFRSLAPHR